MMGAVVAFATPALAPASRRPGRYLSGAGRGSGNEGVCARRSRRVVPRASAGLPPGTEPPPPLSAVDAAKLWTENIMVMYGGKEARDNLPVATGAAGDLLGGEPFFVALDGYFRDNGPVYKLAFGPKVFVVVTDPVIAKSILREESVLFDKGILAEILEDIMGKGLIPADYETWKVRRRAIAPGFHKAWLECMTGMFGDCATVLVDKLDGMIETAAATGGDPPVTDMESEFCSLTLDIIGKAVFNYEFGSVTNESPIIKAVYRVLRESEHRSMSVLPYWKIPGATSIVPRQRAFAADMGLINDTLNTLIESAKATATTADLEELERRDYENVTDPSLLRFLVDLRGEQTTNVQLRDDLMTMLIAGHETTAALLTWALFEVAQAPELAARMRAEIDSVIGDRRPTYDDVGELGLVRRVLAEALRLYPEPPVLIRRCLQDTVLPRGGADHETKVMRGTDIFINVYSLHRSPELWENPNAFDPDRWLRPFANPGVDGWKGYAPAKGLDTGRSLYPNEVAADFAFLPFGGGSRKCVGDQFAMIEAVVSLAMLMRRFDFTLAGKPEDVGLETGATIHTKNGLMMRVERRADLASAAAAGAASGDLSDLEPAAAGLSSAAPVAGATTSPNSVQPGNPSRT